MANKRELIATPEGILCFPHVWEPYESKISGKSSYNIMLVFPKGTDISALKAAVKKAYDEKWPGGAKGVDNPFRDGNEKVGEWGEVFRDATYIRASSQYQPGVVDRSMKDILVKEDVYSGVFARAVVAPYAFDKGMKGVGFGLEVVQILRDGERLGGSGRAMSLLGEVPSEGPVNPDDIF